MLSHFYEGKVSHSRITPRHALEYKVWFAYINLDEVEDFCKLSKLCSYRKTNIFSFYEEDYLFGVRDLKTSVKQKIFEISKVNFDGDIFLLTTLRQLGYSMNPISLFYCFNKSQELEYIVADVHNTPWNERHVYVLECKKKRHIKHVKDFHVSPFMPMDLSYDWNFNTPGSEVQVGIRVTNSNNPVMTANLNLKRVAQSNHAFAKMFMNYSLQSFKTVARIYINAARLWIKGAKFFAHPKKKLLN